MEETLDPTRSDPFEKIVAVSLSSASALPSGIRGRNLRRRANSVFQTKLLDTLRIVVRRVGGAIEVVGTSGKQQRLAAIRGVAEGNVLLKAPLGSYALTTHVANGSHGAFIVSLDVELEGTHSAGMRLTLLREDRELASERASERRVMLPELGPGAYRVVLTDGQGVTAGELDLEICDEPA